VPLVRVLSVSVCVDLCGWPGVYIQKNHACEFVLYAYQEFMLSTAWTWGYGAITALPLVGYPIQQPLTQCTRTCQTLVIAFPGADVEDS